MKASHPGFSSGSSSASGGPTDDNNKSLPGFLEQEDGSKPKQRGSNSSVAEDQIAISRESSLTGDEVYVRPDGKRVRRVKKSSSSPSSDNYDEEIEVYVRVSDGKKVRRVKKVKPNGSFRPLTEAEYRDLNLMREREDFMQNNDSNVVSKSKMTKIWLGGKEVAVVEYYSQVEQPLENQSSVDQQVGQVLENQPIDVYVLNDIEKISSNRSCFSSAKEELMLDEGRPRQLSSLPLATWNLLAVGVEEYKRGLNKVAKRIAERVVSPAAFVWGFSFAFWLVSRETYPEISGLVYFIASFVLIAAFIVYVFIRKSSMQKHINEVFLPSIQTVLHELSGKLLEGGYEVKLFVTANSNAIPFLRFTPVRDEDRDIIVTAADTKVLEIV